MNYLILIWALALGETEPCKSLVCAVISKDLNLVERLLESGESPNIIIEFPDAHRNTHVSALMYAFMERNEDLAMILLEHGANPTVEGNPHTALTLAVTAGMERLVAFIIDSGLEDPSLQYEGFTPLSQAVSLGKYSMVGPLLEAGAPANFVRPQFGFSALDSALMESDEYSSRILLKTLDDSKSLSSRTIAYGAQYTNLSMVKLLEEKSENISSDPKLLAAVIENCKHQERILESVLNDENRSDCSFVDQIKKVMSTEAIWRSREIQFLSTYSEDLLVNYLGNCGIDYRPSRKTEEVPTSLESLKSSQTKPDEVIASLVKNGREMCQSGGESVFHTAFSRGDFRVINFILAPGATEQNPFLCATENDLGDLHLAVLNMDFDRVTALLAGKSDPNISDSAGLSPLAMALALGADGLAFLLIENGAKTNTITSYGQSLLHFSALGDSTVLSNLGLDQGIEIGTKDSDGRTALTLAAASECESDAIANLYQEKVWFCERDDFGLNVYDYIDNGVFFGGKSRIVASIKSGTEDASENRCPDSHLSAVTPLMQ